MDSITVALTIPASPQATAYDWQAAIAQNIAAASGRGDVMTAQSLGGLLSLIAPFPVTAYVTPRCQ